MKKRIYLKEIFLSAAMLMMALCSMAQSRIVSGVVTSGVDSGPLIGVTVRVKGGSEGVVTDARGRYSLSVPGGNTELVFSYVGYASKTINVSGQSVINVTMTTDSKHLSDLVVTAFGIKRQKRSLGYSIQEVDGSKLVASNETNVMNTLQGRVAGVQINSSSAGPGGSVYVAIRGNSSLGGNNQPLYVVDGVPINNDNLDQASYFGGHDYGDGIKDINPDDIASVSVLKGPNAAALYGSRGANGVVIITTKRGTKKGLGVTFNSDITLETPNSIPTFQRTWAGGYDGNFTSWNTTTVNGNQYIQWPNWLVDNWGGKMDGQLYSIQTLPDLGLVPLKPQPANNIKDFYRTGQTFTNTLTLSSVTDKINFWSSFSNLSNKGIIPNNSMNKQSIDMLVSANITNKLTVEVKANYIKDHNNNRPYLGQSQRNLAVDLNWIPQEINLNWLKNYKNPDGTMRSFKSSNNATNPYWNLNEVLNNDSRDRLIGYVSLNYKFTNWLNLKLRTSTDYYTDLRNQQEGVNSPSNPTGYVRNEQYNVNEINSDFLLTAAGKLSSNFKGSFSVGANRYTKRIDESGSWGIGLYVPNLYTVPNTLQKSSIFGLTRKQINSVYGTGELGYKDYLFLDASARNDWSSTLSPGYYSFFYPSVSLSYIFTDALHIQSKLLNYGKLRASWAQAGSDAEPYLTDAGYWVQNNSYDGLSFAGINPNIPATNLKNELKTSWELGTDLTFLNSRLSLDFTYYNSATTNQILSVQIPTPTGFSNKLVNSGKVTNKGIELFLTARPIAIPNSFNWEITFNYSKNRSEVVSLYPGVTAQILYGASWFAAIEAQPGHPYGDIVGYNYLRTANGQLLLDQNGVVQQDTTTSVLGNIQPKWLGGVTNTFSYKGFVLSILVDMRIGGQIYSGTMYDQMARGTGKFTENGDHLINKGVIDDGSGHLVPDTIVLDRQNYYAMQAWGGITKPFVLSATYVALREVTFGYNFKPGLLSKIMINSARLSVVGRNLLYFYRDPMFKTMGIAPEGAFAPTAVAQGYEASNIPSTRSIGFDLSLGF